MPMILSSKKMRTACFVFILSLSLMSGIAHGQHKQESLRIGLIADIQYADKADRDTRFYKASVGKLQESMEAFNEAKVDFTVVLGDFVDEGPKDWPPIRQLLQQSVVPVYKLLGNHDYESVEDPCKLYETFEMPAPYYSLDTAGWRFVFLNTNELSAYATVAESALEVEFKQMASELKIQQRSHVQPWNGGIGHTQMKWLEEELNTAKLKDLKVLVLTHHPLLPENNGHEALNNREILNLLSDHKHVKAVISGHNHVGAFACYQGLPCITLEGMVETADQNAYGILDVFENKLIIVGQGRLTSREIAF